MCNKIVKKYLILGHARSGTGYTSLLFQKAGLAVWHEAMGKDGISSWQYAVKHMPLWDKDYIDPRKYEFKTVIQIIRNPVDAIASIAYTEKPSEEFRSRFVLMYGNGIQKATMSYIGWNKLILAQKPDYIWQLENVHVNMSNLLKTKVYPEKPYNTKKHKTLTLNQIKQNIDQNLFEQLQQFIYWYNSLND